MKILKFALIYFALLNFHASSASVWCNISLWPKAKKTESRFLDRATFGPEFSFTNSALLSEKEGSGFPIREKTHKRIRDLLERRCKVRKDCHISIGSDKKGGNFQVIYNDGFFLQIGIDEGVLEAQTIKGTYHDFVKNKKRIQRDLFDAMKSIGLEPHPRAGGGHIHVGADIFHEDPILFRNFFADYANYPQLPYGALDSEDKNHPPIAVLKNYQQRNFAQALRTFDTIAVPELKNFIWLIHSEVYTEAFTPDWGGGAYYQAIRMDRMYWNNGMNTFELRGIRAQRSMDDFLLELELIGTRMDYLKAKGERVAYRFENQLPDFTPQGIVDAYYTYVTEMGLPWRKYRQLIPVHLHYLNPYKQKKGLFSSP